MIKPLRFSWILLALAGVVLAGGFVSLGPGPFGIALGEDSQQANDTDNPGQVQAQAALEAHRAAHRSNFARVVQYMPAYSIASGDRTSIFLLSMFADPISVTVTAYDIYGRPYPLFDHVVEPRTHLELSLNQALASAGSRYLQGSVSIEYQGEASTVSAWAVLERGSHATEIPFSVASQFQSTTLRAFWDRLPLRHMANGIPTYAVMNTASIPLTFSVTIEAGSESSLSNHRLQPNARRVLTMPQNAESGSLVIQHQGLPGDLVGAGLLEGNGLVAPLPVVDPATLESSKHHALRVPTSGWLRTWLTLSNPTVRSQTATLSAYDPVSGARLARITQTVGAETVETVSLVTLFGSLGSTRPREVRITVEHQGSPRSLLVSGAKLGRSGQVQGIAFFQDSQAHHNGTYPLPNVSRGAVSTTWLNLGASTAKVVAQLDWEGGGSYALPEISIAPGASHRLDFAELIRKAKPDLLGRKLNRSYRKGFFRWSARGGSRKLLARTEVGPVAGGQFGFNCTGCCLEFPYGAIEPGSATFLVGSSASFVAGEYRNICAGGLLGPFNASSPTLTVPSPFSWNGFTLRASSPGSGTLSFTATATRYEVISGICMAFTDTVASSGGGRGVKVTLGRVTRGSGLPDSVPPGRSKTVWVKIEPTLTSGYVQFEVIDGSSSNGTAEIAVHTTRTSEGPISVRGVSQTSPGSAGNLRVRASLNGGSQSTLSRGFSVCAHPTNFRQIQGSADQYGNLVFRYQWDSDSGSLSKLSKVTLGEHVSYPGPSRSYRPPNPPFNVSYPNPTISNGNAKAGAATDTHYAPSFSAGPASRFGATQHYRYKCQRCNMTDFRNILGPLYIIRIVEFVDGVWRYRAKKSGVTAIVNYSGP